MATSIADAAAAALAVYASEGVDVSNATAPTATHGDVLASVTIAPGIMIIVDPNSEHYGNMIVCNGGVIPIQPGYVLTGVDSVVPACGNSTEPLISGVTTTAITTTTTTTTTTSTSTTTTTAAPIALTIYSSFLRVTGYKYDADNNPLKDWDIYMDYWIPGKIRAWDRKYTTSTKTDSQGHYIFYFQNAVASIDQMHPIVYEEAKEGWECLIPGSSMSYPVSSTELYSTSVGVYFDPDFLGADGNIYLLTSIVTTSFYGDYNFYNTQPTYVCNQSHDMDFLLKKTVTKTSVYDILIAKRRTIGKVFDLLTKKAVIHPLPVDTLVQKAIDKTYTPDILMQQANESTCDNSILIMMRHIKGIPMDILNQKAFNRLLYSDVLVKGTSETSYGMGVNIQETIVYDILENTQRYIPQFPATALGFKKRPYNIFDSRKETKT